jgi:hypothetical protein
MTAPRLLSLQQAGQYLGCSYWTVRDYVLAALIPVVHLPALRPREGDRAKASLRRVLIDREDLDRFIESRKGALNPAPSIDRVPTHFSVSARDVQSRKREIEPVNTSGNRCDVPAVCPNGGPR